MSRFRVLSSHPSLCATCNGLPEPAKGKDVPSTDNLRVDFIFNFKSSRHEIEISPRTKNDGRNASVGGDPRRADTTSDVAAVFRVILALLPAARGFPVPISAASVVLLA